MRGIAILVILSYLGSSTFNLACADVGQVETGTEKITRSRPSIDSFVKVGVGGMRAAATAAGVPIIDVAKAMEILNNALWTGASFAVASTKQKNDLERATMKMALYVKKEILEMNSDEAASGLAAVLHDALDLTAALRSSRTNAIAPVLRVTVEKAKLYLQQIPDPSLMPPSFMVCMSFAFLLAKFLAQPNGQSILANADISQVVINPTATGRRRPASIIQ